ncbi:hypothetical protein F5Y08DRAFT_66500 [Xylaria arbuscula]|nr:hypothetical protein F5Y08DRAFT_66500 [Xylaria arbuscula]
MPPTRLILTQLHKLPSPAAKPLRRTFLSSILSSSPTPPQTLTASRRLPHNHVALYNIIADIDSYSAFLPYCSSSRVTSWTAQADPEFGRRWPTRADLTAGWGGLEQTYTSRVFCVPGSIVEALSGDGARSGIAPGILAKYVLKDESDTAATSARASTVRGGVGGEEEGVFKTLVTRWTVTPMASTPNGKGEQAEWSEVNLSIRFQFANPLYGAVSSAIADKIAPLMIEAFVERAKKVLE